MFFIKFVVFAVIATSSITALNYKIQFYIGEDGFPNGNFIGYREVHCFHLDNGNNPIYVRGTYHNRGYFEGPIVNGVAHVNYIEVAYDNTNGLTPTAGAGILTYNSQYNVTDGKFWASGSQSNFQEGDVSPWGIIDKVEFIPLPRSMNDAEIAEQYCFWDITNTAGYTRDHIHFKPWWVLGVANPNTWYTLNVGFQESFGGAIAGAYRYTYSTEDCNNLYGGCKKGRVEWGIYSQETAIAGYNNSLVLATEWKATSGPLVGESGSALYALVAGPDGKAKQIGFFCNSKRNVDYPNLPYKKILTSCSVDSNNHEQPDTAANRKLSQTLLKTYAKKEYLYWWRSLSVFINTIFGNHFSSFVEGVAPLAEVDMVAAVEESPVELVTSTSGRRMLQVVASWWEKIWM
eukprot:gene11649-12710_t